MPILAKSIEEALRALTTGTPGQTIRAHLYGLVAAVYARSSNLRFIVLTDGTAKIQLVAERERLGTKDDAWDAVKQLKPSNLIEVTGEVALTDHGLPSVFLTEPPLLSPSLSVDRWPTVTQIGNQILLARVKKTIAQYLDNQDFLELAPLCLSTSWHPTEIDILRVSLPGFGVPLYLAPTPTTQLWRAIATTGHPKVYAISKCFTIEHVSEHDAVESDIAVIQVLNGNIEDVLRLAQDIIKLVLELAPRHEALATLLSMPHRFFDDMPVVLQPAETPVLAQTHRRSFKDDLFGTREVCLFACYLPFARLEGQEVIVDQSTNPFIACSGAVEEFRENLRSATLTIHIDRLVKFIHKLRYPDAIPNFRTLIDLGIKGA